LLELKHEAHSRELWALKTIKVNLFIDAELSFLGPFKNCSAVPGLTFSSSRAVSFRKLKQHVGITPGIIALDKRPAAAELHKS
jgi:hypothetical protein